MKLEIPLPGIVQVHNTHNYKGNPRAVLTIDGEQVLYLNDHVDDTDFQAMLFRNALARMFLRYLTENEPYLLEQGWAADTDREIDSEQYEIIRLVREE